MRKMSKGRMLLSCMVIIALLLTSTACGGGGDSESSESGKTYTLRMSTLASKGLPLYEGCVWFADRVSELTDGNVKIDLYPSSQLGDYISVMGEVMMGSIDLSWESVAVEYDNRLPIIATPYLATNWDEIDYTYAKGGWYPEFLSKVASDLDMVVIGGTPGGFLAVAGNNVGDINSLFNPDVKKNVLCRIPGTPVAGFVFEALNYNTTIIPYSDLYSALQTGVADCWYGGDVGLNYEGFRDVIKYYVAFDVVSEYYPLFMSEKSMNKLPEEYQEAIIQAGWEASEQAYTYHKDAEEEYYQKLADYGIEVIRPNEKEMQVIASRVREAVWPKLTEIISQDLVDELFAHVEQREADMAQ